MKRFVICLDGTWNNTSREVEHDDGSSVYRPTNVLKLARAVHLLDSGGVSQVTYYNAGVGAMNRAPDAGARVVRWVDNTVGGGWGAGFEVNIEEAYTFLSNNYEAGDEIFIFGFSRGAAQARSLCRLIEWMGGVPTKNDAYYVPRIITDYLETKGERPSPTLWERQNERRQASNRRLLDPIVPANIVFLGVWDTVLALGSRFRAGGGTTRKGKQFHTPAEPPATVTHVRHGIAIDEGRHDFQVEVFRADTGHASLKQRWFPGVHSDVGGGLGNDSLANGALHWMVNEATDAGLDVRGSFLDFFGKNAKGQASTKSRGFKIIDTIFRPIRGFNGVRDMKTPPGMDPDDSVFERLNAGKVPQGEKEEDYRPENLLEFLAANQKYDERLNADVLAIIKERRN